MQGMNGLSQAFTNGFVMGSSDTSMTESIGVKGQDNTAVGLLNYSKIRYKDKKNLTLALRITLIHTLASIIRSMC